MQVITGTLPNSGNYKKGRSGSIKYIVIHYTANHGDTAANNVRYFSNNAVKASAHYFVDENNIYSSVPIYDTAYHCGGGLQGKNGHAWFGYCKNSNSIGIEMCLLDKNGYIRKGTIAQCVELVKYLMKKYSIPPENVIRHWDVTGKNCPAPFTGDNNAYWQDFKNRISEEEINMDELNALKKEVAELTKRFEESQPMIYDYIDKNMPEWAHTAVKTAVDKGIIKGDEYGKLGLTYSDLRSIVREYRLGLYD